MPGRRLTPTCRRCAERKSWPELTARQGGIRSVCACVYGKRQAYGTVPRAVASLGPSTGVRSLPLAILIWIGAASATSSTGVHWSPLANARGADYCGLNPVARRKASTYLPSFFVARPFRYSTNVSKSFGSQSGRYLLIEGSNWLTCLLTALIFRSTTSVISTQ